MDTNERYANHVADKYSEKLANEQNKTSKQAVYQINKLARKALEFVNFL